MRFYRDFKNIVIDGYDFVSGTNVRRFIRQDPYEDSVVEQLNKVWGSWTGWAVLREIIDSGKAVTIVPYTTVDAKIFGNGNAYAGPASWIRAMDGSPAETKVFMGGKDDPSTPKDERYRVLPILKGTGRGTDANVHYTPGKPSTNADVPVCPRDGSVSVGPCRLSPAAATGLEDLLVHELVHALRLVRGQLNSVPTWDKGYDNEEEFFAILVANTYLSEKGKSNLVPNHHGYSPALSSSLSTSEKFLGNGASPPSRIQLENRRMVHKVVCQNHSLCAHICSKVTAAFNPIREFMRNAQLYPLYPR